MLGDSEHCDDALPHFLSSEDGFRFLASQLQGRHPGNEGIVSKLREEYGLVLPFRTYLTGQEPVQLAAGPVQRSTLAMAWLEGRLWLPASLRPHAEIRRLLRQRGCSLSLPPGSGQ